MFAPAVLLLLAPLGAAAPADGLSPADTKPHWIWAPGEVTKGQSVRLRTTFSVGKRPKTATLSVAADNRATVWLGGTKVLDAEGWAEARVADVTALAGGRNKTLAVVGTNTAGRAGVLVVLDLTYPDGSKKRVISDDSWKAAPANPAGGTGWTTPGFAGAADWANAKDLGKVGVPPWRNVRYGSDLPVPTATPAEDLEVADGYEVELLYSVPKETQGSWVAMTAAPNGDLVVSDQYGKLYRVTPPAAGDADAELKVAPIAVEVGMAQGLLCVGEDLYVVVNDPKSSGLYKVTDADGDGAWDTSALLKRLDGAGEHGPHAVRLDPEDPTRLWVVAGNHTEPPAGFDRNRSPVKNYREDLLLPRNPDGNGHATGRLAPAGWVASCDLDGKDWHLYASGFWNPYDIAFDAAGELFTFDGDMEWDTGTPWYRPTRLNHVVSGGEYGWRFGTGKWPEYYADSVGSVVDLGLGSPTGVEFAAGTDFPDPGVAVPGRLDPRARLRGDAEAGRGQLHGEFPHVPVRPPAAGHGPLREPARRQFIRHHRRAADAVRAVPGALYRAESRADGAAVRGRRGRPPHPAHARTRPHRGAGRLGRPLAAPRVAGPFDPLRRPRRPGAPSRPKLADPVRARDPPERDRSGRRRPRPDRRAVRPQPAPG